VSIDKDIADWLMETSNRSTTVNSVLRQHLTLMNEDNPEWIKRRIMTNLNEAKELKAKLDEKTAV